MSHRSHPIRASEGGNIRQDSCFSPAPSSLAPPGPFCWPYLVLCLPTPVSLCDSVMESRLRLAPRGSGRSAYELRSLYVPATYKSVSRYPQ